MFLWSFGAATMLPIGCEAIYIGYLALSDVNALWLFIVASLANILGGVVNYYMGLGVDKIAHNKWLDKAKALFTRFGGYTLLFSWVFIIGDPLTMVAGLARYNFWKFLILMSIGKVFRFLFLWAGVIGYFKITG
jgi:membrane protein YqaA with SNARE-associated domain